MLYIFYSNYFNCVLRKYTSHFKYCQRKFKWKLSRKQRCQDAIVEYELADESYQSNSKEDNLYSPTISSVNINEIEKKLEPVLLADINKAALEFFFRKKKTNIEEDMNLCFLKCLSPDIKLMTSDHKWRYKVQMINATSLILSE